VAACLAHTPGTAVEPLLACSSFGSKLRPGDQGSKDVKGGPSDREQQQQQQGQQGVQPPASKVQAGAEPEKGNKRWLALEAKIQGSDPLELVQVHLSHCVCKDTC